VKSRLAAAIGPEAALDAYQTMVRSTLARLKTLPNVELRYTPDDAADEVRLWRKDSWILRPQGPGDLGERMQRAFVEAFTDGAGAVVIIGSDCPDVSVSDVLSAWARLNEHDLVLGPASDGGYWLIGLRQPQQALFQHIAWSTNTVQAETLARAQRAEIRTSLLRTLSDIDTEQEWLEFSNRRRSASSQS
jgi:rSAM/selenodomain-associated transferase 1